MSKFVGVWKDLDKIWIKKKGGVMDNHILPDLTYHERGSNTVKPFCL